MKFQKLLLTFLIANCLFLSYTQKQREIMFYNVENLYDTINDPLKDDEEFLPQSKNEWNTVKYNEKIAHINKVINECGNPLLVGVCEIENKQVLKDIINNSERLKSKFDVVHFESNDVRGIDVGLLYDKSTLKLKKSGFLRYTLPDTAHQFTRDILWAQFKKGKSKFYVLVNHWPSRRGGEKESEVNRLIAAKQARNFIDSISKIEKDSKFIFMGDLNDYPTNEAPKLVYQVLNQMIFKTSGEFGGSYNYKNEWDVLDHIAVSNNLIENKGFRVIKDSGKILSPEYLIETYKGNKVPFRTYAKNYLGGYSDHLPVRILIEF